MHSAARRVPLGVAADLVERALEAIDGWQAVFDIYSPTPIVTPLSQTT
jgi:hypothetical protein